jgi:cyclopropane fatty-acyl-phospholipid synthase-like methyltransferase
MENNRSHWENIYSTKTEQEVSWFQAYPATSIEFIESLSLSKTASIIDIGGGESHLVDALLDRGYENVWVLDISSNAIEKAKMRLGEKASRVQWIVADVTAFISPVTFDCWHDRATFHFMTTKDHVSNYLAAARQCIKNGAYAIIGAFSLNGPEKCSGLTVKQYSEETLTEELNNGFKKIKCIAEDHTTPFNTIQNFLFCSFKRTETKP